MVMNKYENWSKVLIEPSSLNDARLFTLETRLHEEEDVRIKEFEKMRDCMRKLVYTIQENEQTPEIKMIDELGNSL
jgi:predicted Ser/Thr protein kinase